MKKILLLIILNFFCSQCISQEKEKNKMPKLETISSQTLDENYFVGNWQNSKTYFTSENKKELQASQECDKNSYWKFIKENGILKQSKFTAKGENCRQFISTTYGRVKIENNMMTYFVDDVNYTVKIKIISTTEFVVMTSDYIGGKMVSIEKTFTKI
ncbi:hypothetical protein [Halpernia sp.]|uniref:hypothetical protein n=1 Tax=Halpernia sp. TaxID=2782209 RepID=UPI003A91EDB3